MKVLAIVQARCNSTRFPNKILKSLGKKKTVIQILLQRLSRAKLIDKIVVATTKSKCDDKLAKYVKDSKNEIAAKRPTPYLERIKSCAL